MNQNIKNNFEVIIKLASAISIVVFISSILRSYFFFNQFGVNFSEYIIFRDVPRYIIKDLVVYLPPIILVIVTTISTYFSPYNTTNDEKTSGLLDFFHLYWKEFLVYGLIIICFILLYFNNPFRDSWSGRLYDYYLMIIPLYTVLLCLIVAKNIDKKEIDYGPVIYGILGSIAFYISMVFGVVDANEIMKGKNDNISVEFKDKSIYSVGSGHRYIGRTSQYVFIIDSLQATHIFPAGDVTNILIKKRK